MRTMTVRLMLSGPQVLQDGEWLPYCLWPQSWLLMVPRVAGGIEMLALQPAARGTQTFCVYTDGVEYGVGTVGRATQHIQSCPESLYDNEEAARRRLITEVRKASHDA